MKGNITPFMVGCPEVDESFIRSHINRLSRDYFERFSYEEICEHINGLFHLNPETPFIFKIKEKDELIECTLLAKDYPYEFSLITGLLSANGFYIISGDIFTYDRIPEDELIKDEKITSIKRSSRHISKTRFIVDSFVGRLEDEVSLEEWSDRINHQIETVIKLLESGESDNTNQAKHMVNELVVKRLEKIHPSSPSILYPVHIDVDNKTSSYTKLIIRSIDTFAFLYSLSNALSLRGISIEHVRIRTKNHLVRDEIYLLDDKGRKITDSETLNRIKFSVIFTKQFTYFLVNAPDPFIAISRFNRMVEDITSLPDKEKWFRLLTNPKAMEGLSKVLGTSQFLWEDFIRQQYESLIPIFRPYIKGKKIIQIDENTYKELDKLISNAKTYEEKCRVLNEFKDRTIFLIDLEHILNPEADFRFLSKNLSLLAEIIIRKATELVYEKLRARYGTPRTAGGLEVKFAVMGLGKMGGAALGYASDIELLFIYSDNGKTDGALSITNAEFFDQFVKEFLRVIKAKREGIFEIDLRLRPYGSSGPLACSLDTFCKYYGPGGASHSYERLALIRMRAISGSMEFGKRVEKIRNEILYSKNSINLKEIKELREKQFIEMTKGVRLNAKYSPGGLVDVEYWIQILQVIYGHKIERLKTPLIHDAIKELANAGVISNEEGLRLSKAYNFLRELINAMRILRGSAKDLFLPPFDSDESHHLSRRMGYKRKGALSPSEQLRMDFETHTASVRTFLEKHFGHDALPGEKSYTFSDIVLSETITEDVCERILKDYNFVEPKRAYKNIKSLAGDGIRKEVFARLMVIALDVISGLPDPDMALNNWERFIRVVPSAEFHFRTLLSQPMRLEILLTIMAYSQFLSDVLIRNPGFFEWIISPEVLHTKRQRMDIEKELREISLSSNTHKEWLNRIRRLKRREILRTGTRDICLNISLLIITEEISNLADGILEAVLERNLKYVFKNSTATEKKGFCIMALGKLGGRELNYSSDIDIMAMISKDEIPYKNKDYFSIQQIYTKLMESTCLDISSHTEEGYAFRVDLRLRPFGREGLIVQEFSRLIDYYTKRANLWELQSLLKIRPVAGDMELGEKAINRIKEIIQIKRDTKMIKENIIKHRRRAIQERLPIFIKTKDIKVGSGGIRDIEFLVQGLQFLYAPHYPELIEGNTLKAIDLLKEKKIIDNDIKNQLTENYIFLRRLEHFLQIMEDRQIHWLPSDKIKLDALARRILGHHSNHHELLEKLNEISFQISDLYNRFLYD